MILDDISALITALEGQDWLGSFALAVKIAQEVIAALTKQGTDHRQALKSMTGLPTTPEGITTALRNVQAGGLAAGSIDWQTLFALIVQLLTIIGPLLKS